MTQPLPRESTDAFLYQRVMALIEQMRDAGNLKPGDKLPSLRRLSAQLAVSIPTVKQAYLELERQGKIEARAKSGYFLKVANNQRISPSLKRFNQRPVPVRCQSLIEETFDAVHAPDNLPLGVAHPVAAHSPHKALARIMRQVMGRVGANANAYGPMNGYLPLRELIAQRYLEMGIAVGKDDLVITNGAQEALAIALQCVAKPGDVIAVESPTYFGVLELIENLGMLALEVPTCSEDGVCLNDLAQALDSHPVKAVLMSSLINNPLGSMMPEHKRRDLVALCESKNIPLIEDDVYRELHFAEDHFKPLQYYSKKNLVITCSSFSKTAAPGYRVGWLVTPRFEEKAKGLKRAISCSSPLLNQQVLFEFVRSGEFDRNLKNLKRQLLINRTRMMAAIDRYFPETTRIAEPKGGCVIWVELPVGNDAIDIFRQAVARRISVTPGPLFSPRGRYKRHLRLSFGLPWNDDIERAIETLGRLIKK